MKTPSSSEVVIVYAQDDERAKLEVHVRRCIAELTQKPLFDEVGFVPEELIRKRADWTWFTSTQSSRIVIVFSCEASRRIHKNARDDIEEIVNTGGGQCFWSDRPKQDLAKIDDTLRAKGLHIATRLASILDEFRPSKVSGALRVENWMNNFKRIGADGIGNVVLTTLEVFSPLQLAAGLRMTELHSESMAVCKLTQIGSDLLLDEIYQQHAGRSSLPLLRDVLSDSSIDASLLLIDYVHTGDQLIDQLSKLPKFQGTRRLSIRPFQATQNAMDRVSEFTRLNLGSLNIEWDTKTTIKVDCQQSWLAQSTELGARLVSQRYPPARIERVLAVCERIGSELRAWDLGSNTIGQNGMGHGGLGLTSFVINSISKAVLPILRLGADSQGGDCLVDGGTQKFTSWIALLHHENSSGKG